MGGRPKWHKIPKIAKMENSGAKFAKIKNQLPFNWAEIVISSLPEIKKIATDAKQKRAKNGDPWNFINFQNKDGKLTQ